MTSGKCFFYWLNLGQISTYTTKDYFMGEMAQIHHISNFQIARVL
jgi:hypothetical protein